MKLIYKYLWCILTFHIIFNKNIRQSGYGDWECYVILPDISEVFQSFTKKDVLFAGKSMVNGRGVLNDENDDEDDDRYSQTYRVKYRTMLELEMS